MRKETENQVIETGNRSLSGDLIGDIRSLIETARHNVAVTVNAGLTILYWQIGSRIRQDILKEKRAEYGREIVVTLSRQLSWIKVVSGSPNTQPNCRNANCWSRNLTRPLKQRGNA